MSSKSGFTIIELLVVIGIVIILFALTLIAINPVRNFNAAADVRRKAELNQLQKSFMRYYVEHQAFPDNTAWATLVCDNPVPSPFAPFIPEMPCDPDTNRKYVYQPLDLNCQICSAGGISCKKYRLLTELKNTDDPEISNAGCTPAGGCGITGPNGEVPNYGVAMGCTVNTTPGAVSPTPNPSFSPTPTPTIPITPIQSYTADEAYDASRVSDLLNIILALEKFYFLYGQYPVCAAGWQNAASCLTSYLSPLLINGVIPADPQNGDPYIYTAYISGNNGSYYDGYCLAANLGNPGNYSTSINCPLAAPLTIYQYRVKERAEIIYRPTPNPLSEAQKDQFDAQRKSDILSFKNYLEQYRSDQGHYPNCWPQAYTWASTGSGSFFCQGQFVSYSTNFNFDPGGIYSYNIVQWDPDPDGYFRQYCFASYMDKGDNVNCQLNCPVNNYNPNYCYFAKNP